MILDVMDITGIFSSYKALVKESSCTQSQRNSHWPCAVL